MFVSIVFAYYRAQSDPFVLNIFSVKTVSGSKKCNGNDTCKHIAVNESRVISLIQRGC